ncbi:MAG: hypothetical protein IPM53_00245 [Anaerolineaceae bacterium]|nr:hypothetical protein [Anaerolineaceae bacterium]
MGIGVIQAAVTAQDKDMTFFLLALAADGSCQSSTAVLLVHSPQPEKIAPIKLSVPAWLLRKLFIANAEKIIFYAKFTPSFLQNCAQNMGLNN